MTPGTLGLEAWLHVALNPLTSRADCVTQALSHVFRLAPVLNT